MLEFSVFFAEICFLTVPWVDFLKQKKGRKGRGKEKEREKEERRSQKEKRRKAIEARLSSSGFNSPRPFPCSP